MEEKKKARKSVLMIGIGIFMIVVSMSLFFMLFVFGGKKLIFLIACGLWAGGWILCAEGFSLS